MATTLDRALADTELPAPHLSDGPLQPEPYDPSPARRGLRPAPIVRPSEPAVSLEEGRMQIRDAIARYLAEPTPGRMLLVAAPAGIGKTTLAVQVAEQRAAAGGRVLYAGPRREFFSDVQALASRPQWWYAWQPRHTGDEGRPATCRWAPQIERWLARGYESRTFCSNARICGWDYMRQHCAYLQQYARSEQILYLQYEHVALGHRALQHSDLLIGDELPLRAFLRPWRIPAAAIVVRGAEGELQRLLWSLRALTVESPDPAPTWSGPALLEALGGAQGVLDLCESSDPAGDVLRTPELRGPDDVDEADYMHAPALLHLLHREAAAAPAGEAYVERVHVDREGLTLLLRRSPRTLPSHVIWLDATANARMYETIFGQPVEVVTPNVALRGRVYQMWASLNNKGRLMARPADTEPAAEQQAKVDQLRRQIGQVLARGYRRPALITYKGAVRLLADERFGEQVGHFGGQRGANRLADCDCLIVVGAPQPTIPGMVEVGAMLYDSRVAAFNTEWTAVDVPYQGQPWAWPIGGFWSDPQLQTLLEQFREAELVQAIHRARPLIRDVDVWLLTNAPIRGLPVTLVSLHDLYGAPAGVDAERWPAVVAAAEAIYAGRAADRPYVSTADLAEALGVSRPTAGKWFDGLLQQGWREAAADAYLPAARGRRPRVCVKDFAAGIL